MMDLILRALYEDLIFTKNVMRAESTNIYLAAYLSKLQILQESNPKPKNVLNTYVLNIPPSEV